MKNVGMALVFFVCVGMFCISASTDRTKECNYSIGTTAEPIVIEDMGWVAGDGQVSLRGVLKLVNNSDSSIQLQNIRGDGGSTMVEALLGKGRPVILPGKAIFLAYQSSMITTKYFGWETFSMLLDSGSLKLKPYLLPPSIRINADQFRNEERNGQFQSDYLLQKNQVRMLYGDWKTGHEEWLCSNYLLPSLKVNVVINGPAQYGYDLLNYGDTLHLIEGAITVTNTSDHCIRIMQLTAPEHTRIHLWNNGSKQQVLDEYATIPPNKSVLVLYSSTVIDDSYNKDINSFLSANYLMEIKVVFESADSQTMEMSSTFLFGRGSMNQIIKN
jgi:hypothetical protein